MGFVLGEEAPGFVTVGGEDGLIASLFKLHLHDAAEAGVVVYDEDAIAAGGRGHEATAMGWRGACRVVAWCQGRRI